MGWQDWRSEAGGAGERAGAIGERRPVALERAGDNGTGERRSIALVSGLAGPVSGDR
ncbi:hypothetical protein APASM_0250 [Actinosynnema pretiosum subsp. pretiosum]|nr:hypothetical protein APASM_0250 [Actinosynnema pretiosum subsp. pretiosum]